MLSVEQATATVVGRVTRLPVEHVPLWQAAGRVLAEDVIAARALPGFDNSAMDGYAVRAAEVPATLPIVARVAAGQRAPDRIPDRSAARVLTGAPVPPGLDAIVLQEDVTLAGDLVTLPAARAGDHVRRAGEDLAVGERALRAGARLTAAELGVLAALGVTLVPVVRAPRVALIATGDELVDAGDTPGPGQCVDSSAHALSAAIAACGGIPSYLGITRDDPTAIAAALARAMAYDAVITTGGVSVGDRDHVRAALDAAGVSLELWKVAMKPGKPFAFGAAGRIPVFGLPGNPVSTFVAFELFVRPALLALQGAAATGRPRAPVLLPAGAHKRPGRAHYLRATVVRDGARLIAHPHPKQGSAMLSSLVGCNALVELPADVTEIRPDGEVQAILLDAV